MSSELTTRPDGAVATTSAAQIPEATRERFPAIDPESEILELLAENLDDGETLGIGNLTRVVNPSGKSTSFQVPDPQGGKDKTPDMLEGIVLGWQEGRSYYESPEAKDGTPPDCSSRDGVNGFGEYGKGSESNPDGLCTDCPMGQWLRVEGQPDTPPACKQLVNVLLLTEEEALPLLVRVPRTSITAFNKYRKGLIRYNTGLARSTTKISLESAVNPQGTKYAEMVFSLGEKLPGTKDEVKATAAAVMAFGAEMKNIITAQPARNSAAITATAERSVEDEGGTSFPEPVDYAPPTDEEAADALDHEAETSSAAAS
jgi:hypothetical protein